MTMARLCKQLDIFGVPCEGCWAVSEGTGCPGLTSQHGAGGEGTDTGEQQQSSHSTLASPPPRTWGSVPLTPPAQRTRLHVRYVAMSLKHDYHMKSESQKRSYILITEGSAMT